MSKSGKATRQNVRVICRVRPTNAREIREGGNTCVKYTDDRIDVGSDGGNNTFNFDRVFGMDSTQVDVFKESAAPLIDDVLAGYNATIFAYGQTGTGKTHTMEGDITSEVGKGIIPRAVEALFQGVVEADENIEFTFRVSYVEIYLEKIRDLLDEHRTKTNLAIREDKLKGIYIAGVTEEYVTSVDELLQVMHVGAHNRATAATGMNEGSSRSHSVFTITVTQKDIQTNAQKAGKLVLVDLAGSEMVRKTGASGQQLEEAKMINKSLSALGQVIYALTDDKATHVPYRDSKLTRILQDSLGGNSKTVLIVAVSPSSFNASETVSTLRFGMRAKSIENKVKINATRSVEELEALLVRAENAIDAQSTYIMSLTARLEAVQAQLQQYQGQGLPIPQPVHDPASSSGAEVVLPPNAVILEEGKIIVDVSRLETEAAAIQKLQEDVFRLQQELDDERQDSSRKDGEISSLNRLLSDKERAVVEMEGSMQELQQSAESYQKRIDTLVQEKIAVAGELASVKASVNESTAKVTYQLQEMEVTLSTVQAENESLKREISELSGEQQQQHQHQQSVPDLHAAAASAAGSKVSPNKGKPVIISMDDASVSDDASASVSPSVASSVATTKLTPASSANAITPAAATTTSASAAQGVPASTNRRLSSNYTAMGGRASISFEGENASTLGAPSQVQMDRKVLLEQMADQFASLCLKHGVDDLISADLFAVMDNYAVEAERSFQSTEERHLATDRIHAKRIKDLDEQRLRLQMDLQGRIENMITLQMRLDALTRQPVAGAGQDPKEMAALLERDRAKQKSLQQRLEQLVAVHRQLLRKFATLELENVELKKKTILREERIKQLEDNSRTLVNNVRLQAEKHLAEVAIFREQISIMKIEFEKQYENARQAEEMMMSGVPPGGNTPGAMNNGAVANVVNPNASFFGGSGRSPNMMQRAMLINRNMQPKSIRGGGVGGKSFYVNNSANLPNTGYLPSPAEESSSGGPSASIGSGNNYNSLAATLSPSAMMSRYQSFTFGHHNTAMAPSSTTAAAAKSAVNHAPGNLPTAPPTGNNNNNINNNNNNNSGVGASTMTALQGAPPPATVTSTTATATMMMHMEEPKSMGLAARLLGQNK